METEHKTIPNEEIYTLFEELLSYMKQWDKTVGDKLESINLSPEINLPAPDMTAANQILESIKANYNAMYRDLHAFREDAARYLNGTPSNGQVGREAEKYKEALDRCWNRVEDSLQLLNKRIPHNYDINKQLVKVCT